MPSNIDQLSDDALLSQFAGAPQTAGPAAPAPVDQLSDDDLLSHFAGPDAKGKNVNGDVWGGLRNFGNSYLLGAGIPLSAAANATKETAKEIASGVPVKQAAKDFADYYAQAKDAYSGAQADYAQQHPVAAGVEKTTGEIAGTIPLMLGGGAALKVGGAALTRAAPMVGPAVDFLSGASQGNNLLKYGSQAVNGALQGVGASALTSGDNDAPLGQQLLTGAAAGGVMGAALPAAGAAASGLKNMLVGGGVNGETARLADLAVNKFGIPIRGGQISNSPFVKYADSTLNGLPLTGYAAKTEAAHDAFTSAVSRTFGEDTSAITPEIMQQAKSRIGQVFNKVANNTTVKADQQFATDLARIDGEATQVLPGSELAPIRTQLDNILGKVSQNGEIDGLTYQTLTRKGAPLDRAMSSADPNVKYYAGQIRGALDDALQRSANPSDLAALKGARLQYKNMKTIEDLAEKSPDGRISPALLLGQVRKSFGDYAYGGGGDLGELAQIGQRFMKEPANSGTPTRSLIHGLLGGAGATGELALYMHDPMMAGYALGAGALGTGAARLTAGALNSATYRNMLLNSLHQGPQLANPLTQGASTAAPAAAGITANQLLAPSQ